MNKITEQPTKEQQNYPDWGIHGHEVEHDCDPYYLLYKDLLVLKAQIETTLLKEIDSYIKKGPAYVGGTESIENLKNLYAPTIKELSRFCGRHEIYIDSLI